MLSIFQGKKAPLPPSESLSPTQSSPSHPRLGGDNSGPEKDSVESLETASLYPVLPETFPVPAPRSIKPAVPSKPEGISR